MLRSLHLQKSLSSYNYIHVGAQLKVSVSSWRLFRCRIREWEETVNNDLVQPAAFRQMNDSSLIKIIRGRGNT